MCECNSFEIDRSLLANPDYGRAYLKAALEIGDEEFLKALRAVMDSLVNFELDSDLEVSVLPTWENTKTA